MAKSTRSLSGASQKKYFRDLFRATQGVTPEAVETLTGACEREIAQVRVRLPIPARGNRRQAAKTSLTGDQPAAAEGAAPDKAPTAASPAKPEPAAAVFDPFAFSVVVVVTKEGRDGLMARLLEIGEVDNLKSLAKAQHLAVPDSAASLDDLRAAIIEGALQRVANRRAAAS